MHIEKGDKTYDINRKQPPHRKGTRRHLHKPYLRATPETDKNFT